MAIDLNDKTANGNNLTNVGAVEVNSSLPFAQSTVALDLEKDITAYLYAPDSASLSITGNLTIECWVKLESLPGANTRSTFVAKWNDSINDISYEFELFNDAGTQKLRFTYVPDDLDNTGDDVRLAWTPTLGTWYHVAVAFTAATPKVQMFVDGIQLGTDQSTVDTSIHDSTARLQIGAINLTPVQSFDGVIDEVRIWNTVRTQTQINNNKSIELVGNESGLVAYWPFESTLGTTTSTTTTSTSTSTTTTSTSTSTSTSTTTTSTSTSTTTSSSTSSSTSTSTTTTIPLAFGVDNGTFI